MSSSVQPSISTPFDCLACGPGFASGHGMHAVVLSRAFAREKGLLDDAGERIIFDEKTMRVEICSLYQQAFNRTLAEPILFEGSKLPFEMFIPGDITRSEVYLWSNGAMIKDCERTLFRATDFLPLGTRIKFTPKDATRKRKRTIGIVHNFSKLRVACGAWEAGSVLWTIVAYVDMADVYSQRGIDWYTRGISFRLLKPAPFQKSNAKGLASDEEFLHDVQSVQMKLRPDLCAVVTNCAVFMHSRETLKRSFEQAELSIPSNPEKVGDVASESSLPPAKK